MKKKLFAVAIRAQKHLWRDELVEMLPGFCLADSTAEAEGMALIKAKAVWPTEEGWYKHGVSITEIPQEFIKESLAT